VRGELVLDEAELVRKVRAALWASSQPHFRNWEMERMAEAVVAELSTFITAAAAEKIGSVIIIRQERKASDVETRT
jgi:broad-specificity NMP kinase